MPTEVTDTAAPTASEPLTKPTRVNGADCETSERKFVGVLSDQLHGNRKRRGKHLFGKAARDGAVYRWGIAAALGGQVDELTFVLSRLACLKDPKQGVDSRIDLVTESQGFVDNANSSTSMSVLQAAHAVTWASALPSLTQELGSAQWWRVLSSLQQLHESILQQSHFGSPAHLILGGELGLTLAIRIADLPACSQLQDSAIHAVEQWSNEDSQSLSAAIEDPASARLVLASLIRSRSLLCATQHKRFSESAYALGRRLATWVVAMTIPTGGTAFSDAESADVVDDLGPHGLLSKATKFDRESLQTAVSVALGNTPSGGRLSWQVDLPETIHHDEDAKIAVLMPEWDIRRGRTHLDYSRQQCHIEVFSGRTRVISGHWQTMIEVDGVEQQAVGDWSEVCEYTDDDVHYLEIDQRWTGGIVLERQIMLIRDDRCLYIADAILPADPDDTKSRKIKYASRLPLPDSIGATELAETRDLFLSRLRPHKKSKPRVLVMPLSASEWRFGPTAATLRQTDDNHLLLATEGTRRLYAPVWFDFQTHRFDRNRTWRTLTIANQLRMAPPDEAAGYRIQVGSEQWMIYRSLGDSACRTVLGKHLIAGFFSSRFDTGDGGHEILLKVDDSESTDGEYVSGE